MTVVGMYETVLMLVDLVRYTTPVLCPGQAKAESAAVRKIKMRGMKSATLPKLLVASFICIKSPP